MRISFCKLIGVTTCLLVTTFTAKAQEETNWVYYTNYENTIVTQWSNGQWNTNDAIPGSILLFMYRGTETNLTIPSTITGRPVTWLSSHGLQADAMLVNLDIQEGLLGMDRTAFTGHPWLENVMFPASLTNIGAYNFSDAGGFSNRVGFYFAGNAPAVDPTAFQRDSNATVYYLRGTTGWGATFNGIPTAIWQPQMQVSRTSNGGAANEFGFNVSWASGRTVVVEACTNLSNPGWTAIQTNTLTSGSIYLTDPQWKNYPGRAYRVRSP